MELCIYANKSTCSGVGIMARTKLSGSLLVCKGAPPLTSLAQQPPASRSMIFGPVAVAISVVAVASLSGLLLLQLSEKKNSTETALTITSPATSQPAATVAAVVQSPGLPATPIGPATSAAAPEPPPTAAAAAPEPPPTAAAAAPEPPPTAAAAPISPQPKPVTASSAPVPAAQPAGARLPAEDVAALLARGDALFGNGDIVSARLYYERAAEGGDAQAALRLGETYDSEFLVRIHLNGVRGDAAAAARWYGRARELGAPEAEILLTGVIAKKEQQP
jgi:hypothetical protein